jgi:UDP-N-acetylmuramate dehydrogenase
MTGARDQALVARLREAVAGPVREAELLARYSTFRIGGPATVAHPASLEDVSVALGLAAQAGVRVFVLGLGSNVLLPDEGLEALVLRLGKGLDALTSDGARWRLGAGVPAPLVARRTAAAGWAGLHMMVGVPGTVGGGVYMNAGCHGGDWAAVIQRVTVVDHRGEVTTRPRTEIPFSYRRSGLAGLVVVEAEVELTPREPAELEAEVQRYFAWRQEGTPFSQPCCGSVFKNPEWPAGPPAPALRTAGQLIEACGLKGLTVGRIEVSPLHANYFVNTGGEGRADDVRRLMETVRARVQDRFGVLLEPEVKVIRPSGEMG